MTELRSCSRCGATLPSGSDTCPRCLLELGAALPPRDPAASGDPAAAGDAGASGDPAASGAAGAADAAGDDAPRGPAASRAPRRPAPPPIAEIAARFPQLEILGLVGQGGMAVVYRARQPRLGREVALKILPPEPRTEAPADAPAGSDTDADSGPGTRAHRDFAERFLREAQAMARLSHPNIVAVHDFGETDGLCWLLMEYVDGVNLREALRAGTLTPEKALAIVPQMCDALQYAHDEGVVHRDIKPENVLLDRQGRVRLVDFGLAKVLGAAGAPSLTRTEQVMGTPHYMAPEQLAASRDVDHRADIYSLGVVFYEMLTGQLPVGRFEPPSRRVRVDVRLDEIVLHALEARPERRYQHAVEVKTDVQTVAAGGPPAVARDAAAAAAEGGRARGRGHGQAGGIFAELDAGIGAEADAEELRGLYLHFSFGEKPLHRALSLLVLALVVINAGIASFTLQPLIFREHPEGRLAWLGLSLGALVVGCVCGLRAAGQIRRLGENRPLWDASVRWPDGLCVTLIVAGAGLLLLGGLALPPQTLAALIAWRAGILLAVQGAALILLRGAARLMRPWWLRRRVRAEAARTGAGSGAGSGAAGDGGEAASAGDGTRSGAAGAAAAGNATADDVADCMAAVHAATARATEAATAAATSAATVLWVCASMCVWSAACWVFGAWLASRLHELGVVAGLLLFGATAWTYAWIFRLAAPELHAALGAEGAGRRQLRAVLATALLFAGVLALGAFVLERWESGVFHYVHAAGSPAVLVREGGGPFRIDGPWWQLGALRGAALGVACLALSFGAALGVPRLARSWPAFWRPLLLFPLLMVVGLGLAQMWSDIKLDANTAPQLQRVAAERRVDASLPRVHAALAVMLANTRERLAFEQVSPAEAVLVSEPASPFERWRLTDGQPRREQPQVLWHLVSEGEHGPTSIAWDAGYVRPWFEEPRLWTERVDGLLESVARIAAGN